jgi:hypothetical protein
VQQINGPRSESFGVRGCKLDRLTDDCVQVQRNVQQGAPRKGAFDPVKRSVLLARNMLPRARWQRAAFVECALEDRIPNLQGVQREEEQRRQADPAILAYGCTASDKVGDKGSNLKL